MHRIREAMRDTVDVLQSRLAEIVSGMESDDEDEPDAAPPPPGRPQIWAAETRSTQTRVPPDGQAPTGKARGLVRLCLPIGGDPTNRP